MLFLYQQCYVITFYFNKYKFINQLKDVHKKIVANENTSHLLLRHFNCSIR